MAYIGFCWTLKKCECMGTGTTARKELKRDGPVSGWWYSIFQANNIF